MIKAKSASNIFIILTILAFLLVGLLERVYHPHLTYESKKRHFFRNDVFTNRLVPFLPFSSLPMFSDKLDDGLVSELYLVGSLPGGEQKRVDLKQYGPFWNRGYQLSLQNAVLSGLDVKDHATLLFSMIQKARKKKFQELKVIYGIYNFDSWVLNKKLSKKSSITDSEQVLFKKVYR